MDEPNDELNPDLIALVKLHFEPAADVADASVKLTTRDFHRLIDRHAPGSFFPEDLQLVLRSLKYQAKLIGEDLLWLAKAR